MGEFYVYTVKPQATVQYQMTVTASSTIDVFWFQNRDELNRYRERESDFLLLSGLSARNISSETLTGGATPGVYPIVFDNTAVFGAEPEDEAQVRVELSLEYV